ncbi:unnamed protein product [Lymnaea stagnalis]|uniref:MARVEL domain-containing protein n=1 Tax=Lymnaea stagnalis TaxID=6523 RepID=A0AAV2IBQ3_LYMST
MERSNYQPDEAPQLQQSNVGGGASSNNVNSKLTNSNNSGECIASASSNTNSITTIDDSERRGALDADNDNDNTVSEELSRYSSPSQSQSSSCTSITNPFYDGPQNINESVRNFSTSNRVNVNEPKEIAQRVGQRLSLSSHRKRSSVEVNSGAGSSNVQGQGARGNLQSNHVEEKIQQRVIIVWDLGYLVTCHGFLQFLQMVMTTAALVCLVSAGGQEGGLLNLPLSWHFRIMLFVLILTLLVTVALLFGNLTSLISIFGFEWTFFDMIVYSLFAFLYLVGSSLVASAFDFYEKMKTDVTKDTINQLVTSVILGYICMLLNGLTAFMSYRKWKIQYRLYQRRKLIEEDEIDL